MNPLLVSAVVLIVAIGVAHSYLGERYILIRLFRRDNLPWLFGGDWFTKRTLRFAWHMTTVAWWGLGGIVLLLAAGDPSPAAEVVLRIVSVTFAVHGVVAIVASRGRHLSWVVFGAIAALTWLATS